MIRVLIVVAALILSACSTVTTAPAPKERKRPPVETREPIPAPGKIPAPVVRPGPAPEAGMTAYHKLVLKAADARRQGNYRQAMSLLERAQRIRPQSGDIYYQLAQTARLMGDAANARSIAERGLLYCDNAALCAKLRKLAR